MTVFFLLLISSFATFCFLLASIFEPILFIHTLAAGFSSFFLYIVHRAENKF